MVNCVKSLLLRNPSKLHFILNQVPTIKLSHIMLDKWYQSYFDMASTSTLSNFKNRLNVKSMLHYILPDLLIYYRTCQCTQKCQLLSDLSKYDRIWIVCSLLIYVSLHIVLLLTCNILSLLYTMRFLNK